MISLVRFDCTETGKVWINPEQVCAVAYSADKLRRWVTVQMADGKAWTIAGSLDEVTSLLT